MEVLEQRFQLHLHRFASSRCSAPPLRWTVVVPGRWELRELVLYEEGRARSVRWSRLVLQPEPTASTRTRELPRNDKQVSPCGATIALFIARTLAVLSS
jgi:hypothetical protein